MTHEASLKKLAAIRENQAHGGWSPERVEILKALWIKGLSCSQIALKMGGVSRNSVIGKVHRLGLVGREVVRGSLAAPKKPGGGQRKGAAALARAKEAKISSADKRAVPINGATAPIQAEKPDPTIIGFTLTKLPARSCKWPLSGAGADMVMCGQRADGAYCPKHRKKAYTVTTPLDRKRAARAFMRAAQK